MMGTERDLYDFIIRGSAPDSGMHLNISIKYYFVSFLILLMRFVDSNLECKFCTAWRKKKLSCLIYFKLKAKRAVT